MGALFRRDASGAAGPRGGHSSPPASGRPPIGGDPAVRGGKHHCPVTALGTTHPADTAVECKRSVTGDHREIAKLRQRQGLHGDDRRWPQSERCPLSAVLGACDRSNTRDARGFYLFGEVVARTRLRSARDGASQGSSTTGRPIRSTSRVGRATRLRIPAQGWIGRQPSPTGGTRERILGAQGLVVSSEALRPGIPTADHRSSRDAAQGRSMESNPECRPREVVFGGLERSEAQSLRTGRITPEPVMNRITRYRMFGRISGVAPGATGETPVWWCETCVRPLPLHQSCCWSR